MAVVYKKIENPNLISSTDTTFNSTIHNSTSILTEDIKYRYIYFNNIKNRIIDYNTSSGLVTLENSYAVDIYPLSLFEVTDYEGSKIIDEIISLENINITLQESLNMTNGLKKTETDKNKTEFQTVADTYSYIKNNNTRIAYLRSLLVDYSNASQEEDIIIFRRMDTGYY